MLQGEPRFSPLGVGPMALLLHEVDASHGQAPGGSRNVHPCLQKGRLKLGAEGGFKVAITLL